MERTNDMSTLPVLTGEELSRAPSPRANPAEPERSPVQMLPDAADAPRPVRHVTARFPPGPRSILLMPPLPA